MSNPTKPSRHEEELASLQGLYAHLRKDMDRVIKALYSGAEDLPYSLVTTDRVVERIQNLRAQCGGPVKS